MQSAILRVIVLAVLADIKSHDSLLLDFFFCYIYAEVNGILHAYFIGNDIRLQAYAVNLLPGCPGCESSRPVIRMDFHGAREKYAGRLEVFNCRCDFSGKPVLCSRPRSGSAQHCRLFNPINPATALTSCLRTSTRSVRSSPSEPSVRTTKCVSMP